MNYIRFISISFIGFFANNCAQTSVVLLDDSRNFGPSNTVRILEQVPNESFEIIARLETRGMVGQSIPSLLNQMRDEAKQIGADAIIPVEERQERQQQGIMYNPWLGGYQTIGGGTVPIVTSYAIIFEISVEQRLSTFKPEPIVNTGLSYNILASILGGSGFSGWLGKNRYRISLDYYSLKTPQSMFRDGFKDGRVDNATSIGFDYFFLGHLAGPYFGTGLQFGNYSVGHENTMERGKWGTVAIIGSFGYKLNLSDSFFIDTKIIVNASLSSEEVVPVGNFNFTPDTGSLYGLIGLGVNF